MRFAIASVMLLFIWANPAAADLYRWVDPETGSVKFSSYPPPWYGGAQAPQRAPKVEVIPSTRVAPAFEPVPNADREPAATPAERKEPAGRATPVESAKDASPSEANAPRNDRRDALLTLLSQRVAALVSSAPEATGKAFASLLEPLQELERLDQQLKPSNSREEAARLEEKWQLAVPLEVRRLALMQQISALRPPPAGSAPEAIESAWRSTQLQLSALEWTNEAIKFIDPRKLNARHFEMRALAEKVFEMWEPYVDAGLGRKDRGR